MKPTYTSLQEDNPEALAKIQALYEISDAAMKMACDHYDKATRPFGGFVPYAAPRWKNGQIIGYHPAEPDTVEDFIEDILESATRWVEGERAKVRTALEAEAARIAKRKAYSRPSAEAMRKRKARAEGRVKPRPPRPPRTLAQEVESRRKAVATRQAKLRDMKGIDTMGDRAKMDISLHRAKKALATAERRLAESQKV